VEGGDGDRKPVLLIFGGRESRMFILSVFL